MDTKPVNAGFMANISQSEAAILSFSSSVFPWAYSSSLGERYYPAFGARFFKRLKKWLFYAWEPTVFVIAKQSILKSFFGYLVSCSQRPSVLYNSLELSTMARVTHFLSLPPI